MEEVWKDIPEFCGKYQASSFGRIRSNIFKKIKVLSPATTGGGYLKVSLFVCGKRKTKLVHRLVASAFIENLENKKEINHKNFIRDDNRTINLEWCTAKENTKHTYAAGRIDRSGEENPRAILNWFFVGEIRRLHGDGASHRQLAKRFKVSTSAIYLIVKNKTWKQRAEP